MTESMRQNPNASEFPMCTARPIEEPQGQVYFDQFCQSMPTWKRIRPNRRLELMGEFRRALQSRHMPIGDLANRVIEANGLNLEVPAGIKRVKFIKTTLKEMTGKDEADYFEIYSHFIGLQNFPLAVWLNLRLQYLDQPHNECLYTLSRYEAINVDGRTIDCVLAIDNDPSIGKWLYGRSIGYFAAPTVFSGDSLWLIPSVPMPKLAT